MTIRARSVWPNSSRGFVAAGGPVGVRFRIVGGWLHLFHGPRIVAGFVGKARNLR